MEIQMNQIKRQFTPGPPVYSKKFRRNTCLEDLSNELFCEVFDYLDGYEIYQAFGRLNCRFDNLLSDSSLLFKINLPSESETKLEDLCREFIVPNRHRLRSLKFPNELLIDKFFDYCSLDSSFTCLESVVLNDVSSSNVLMILSFLNSLPCLLSLTITLDEQDHYNLSVIYRLIFHLPHLKYCKLTMSYDGEYDIKVPISMNKMPSTIERLIINHRCTTDEITSLILHTPSLQWLTCKHLINPLRVQTNTNNNSSTLPQPTHISIDFYEADFNNLERFLKPISHQLRVIRLGILEDSTCLDENRWNELVKMHMPKLFKRVTSYLAIIERTL